jgi:hypothetical protein
LHRKRNYLYLTCIQSVFDLNLICTSRVNFELAGGTMHMFDKNCVALFLEHMVPKGETPLETRQLR